MKRIPKLVGIYIIRNTIDRRVYIGLSEHIYKRITGHRSSLKRGNHRNPYLQHFYNKYGDVLTYHLLELCSGQRLKQLETAYIKYYKSNNSKFGFNLTVGGDDNIHLGKPYYLKNFITGQTEIGIGISRFSEKYNISNSGINMVMNNRIHKINGWYCPAYWTPKVYVLISPEGIKHEFSYLKDFCIKHNLDHSPVSAVLHKRRESVQGWTRPDSILNKESLAGIKEFCLISPLGETIKGKNLTKFANDNGLNQQGLNAVMRGKRKSHKGWTLPV